MNLNVIYDAAALAAPQSFRDGIATAVGLLNAAIRDAITVNITVGYGEIGGQALPNQNTSEGSAGGGFVESYSSLRAQLASHATSADDLSSVAALPTTISLQGRSSFTIGTAQAKALGVISANATAVDGQIGIGRNFTGSVLIAGALHEFTHAMGRIDGFGLDLFRYSSPGNHVFGFAIPAPRAYFSVDGGISDLADFGINSDPGDFLNPPASNLSPNDPFNETVGTTTVLTPLDLRVMDVLGFNVGAGSSSPTAPLNQFDAGWNIVGIGDFNGDGRADLAWQRSSDNLVEIQLLNNGAPAGGGIISNSPFDSNWQVAGRGDFNGDGRSDLVYRRVSDGFTEIQLLNGTQGIGGGAISNNPFDANWRIVSTGDFNADGKTDLLWRRNSDALTEIQFLNGINSVGGGVIANNPFDAGWNVAARGDFNGDGTTDLAWRRASDGLVEVQLINGLTGIGGGVIANNPFDASWNVVAAGDFLGNGRADLVWQRASDGLVEIQFLNGNTAVGGGVIANNPFGSTFQVVGAADYNADGRADLVYRRPSDGVTAIQLLNGTTIIGGSTAPAGTISQADLGPAASPDMQQNINLMGRDADAGGLVTYQDALDSGWTLESVRSDIAHSAEVQSDLGRLFQGILNREPSAAELTGASDRLEQGASLQTLENDLSSSGSAGGFAVISAASSDSMTGAGTGPAVLDFSDLGLGNRTVLGFSPDEDTILISHSQLADFGSVVAHSSVADAGTLISIDSSQSILVEGVQLANLQPGNFHFI
jgi:VCBS repeat protein